MLVSRAPSTRDGHTPGCSPSSSSSVSSCVSQRPWPESIQCLLCFSEVSTRRQHSSIVKAAGTSVAACLPACIAATHTGTCHCQGVAVIIRSRSSLSQRRSKYLPPLCHGEYYPILQSESKRFFGKAKKHEKNRCKIGFQRVAYRVTPKGANRLIGFRT